MAQNLPITYHANKARLLKLFVYILLGGSLSYWLLTSQNIHSHYDPLFVKLIGACILVFCCICGAVIFLGLIKKMRLFTISEEGIAGKNNKLIKWSEINKIEIIEQRISRRSYIWIGVFLKDADLYYSSLNPIAKMKAQLDEKIVGTPIVLDCISSKLEPDEINSELNAYLKKFT